MTTTVRRRLSTAAVGAALSLGVLAGAASFADPALAEAVPVDQMNGAVTDASTDMEVAQAAYRDLTMNRFSHEHAIAYASGEMTAEQATRSLNKHLNRYCAASKLIGFALADQGYNSATIQNFYHRSGCLSAPSVTHNGPRG